MAALAGTALLVCALAACTSDIEMHDYDAERDSARDRLVRQNMRTAQIAVEHYAADHGGNHYPTAIDAMFRTYFPGGIEGKREAPVGTINPFTGANEFPELSNAITDVASARQGKRIACPPGKIYYCVLAGGTSYAIIGGAHDGMALTDENNPPQLLVFSNI